MPQKALKVLMYGWEFPPYISGGLGVACYGICKGLLENGVNLALILPTSAPISIDQPNKLPINIKYIQSYLRPYLHSEEIAIPDVLASAQETSSLQIFGKTFEAEKGDSLVAEVYRYTSIAAQHALTIPHDVIHAHDWLSALAGLKAKELSGKPLIFHVHALETDRAGEQVNETIKAIEQFALEHADQIIAVSHYTKQQIMTKYNLEPLKISVVHNALLKEQLNLKKQNKKKKNWILFLGRTTYQKGPLYFLQAAKKVLESRQDIEFIVAGNGDLWCDMVQFVAQHRLGKYIHFAGFLPNHQVKDIFSRCKIYVMPSVSEPFGIACLEALANQVPVILSKQTGVAEVFPQLIKVDFWETHALAKAMIDLISTSGKCREQVKQANKILPHITWNNVAVKIIDIYNQVSKTVARCLS